MDEQQDIIDKLIDYIDKAILKNSVSNRHVASVLSFFNERLKKVADTNGSLSKDIRVTSPKTGNINTGDLLKEGTTFESIFRTMLTGVTNPTLTAKLSTANDVEFGSAKGQISYTASRNSSGVMTDAYYDNIKQNKLIFSAETNGIQTAVRQLEGNYTQGETYIASVIYAPGRDGITQEITLTNTVSVNVRRKWFAGVCNAVPTTSSEVRSLASNGLYTGAGTYKFNTSNWKIVAVCIPADTIKEISIASSYGNFVENGKVCTGPTEILVEGANGSEAIKYKMWVIQTSGTNDPDSFTFKTI